eukprot:GILI01011359.1.p1 GENE.GILI01011359.1~~GILI01011359.1.p1  ORF type:complete len:162 (-),score=28.17 GILI01011359.1:151-636(-)
MASKAAAKGAASAASAATKAVKANVRMIVGAATAKPSPAIGQALGPLGVNMMQFCKEFNAKTSEVYPEVPMCVMLTAYEDRTFNFTVRSPQASWFLKRAAKVDKGSSRPGHDVVGKINIKYIYEIAKLKIRDPGFEHYSLEGLCKCLVGTCRTLGLQIVKD